MQIIKKDLNKIFTLFLLSHLLIWTLVPSIFNTNLPLDLIEAIAWGYDWPLGWDKHPPLSVWFTEFFYQIFGNQDWVYYFLGQLFVVSSFFIVWKFSLDFFRNPFYSFISVLFLEGMFFYNYAATEFNVNICQLPFWALTVYYFWKGLKNNNLHSWILLGIFAGLGVLSKYIFIYLLLSIFMFFLYAIYKKEFNNKCLFSLISFLVVISPHLFWLIQNNFATINYALIRSINDPLSVLGLSNLLNHLFHPLMFVIKQLGILLPSLIMLLFIFSNFKIKKNYLKKIKNKTFIKDKKLFFLFSTTIMPIILVFLTSVATGSKIKTMWMTPFYLFIGVLLVYIFQKKIELKKIKKFFLVFLLLFILFPTIYLMAYVYKPMGRTDYPGKVISKIVQTQWDNNFSNKLEIVIGHGYKNEFYAQNLSYHLKSRPKWKKILEGYSKERGVVVIKGFNEISNCSGILYKIDPFNDICMLGEK